MENLVEENSLSEHEHLFNARSEIDRRPLVGCLREPRVWIAC